MVQETKQPFRLRSGRAHVIVRGMEATLPAEIEEEPGVYAIAFDIPQLGWSYPLVAPGGNPVAYIGVATDVRERCEHHFFGPAKASAFRITAWGLLRALAIAPELSQDIAEA